MPLGSVFMSILKSAAPAGDVDWSGYDATNDFASLISTAFGQNLEGVALEVLDENRIGGQVAFAGEQPYAVLIKRINSIWRVIDMQLIVSNNRSTGSSILLDTNKVLLTHQTPGGGGPQGVVITFNADTINTVGSVTTLNTGSSGANQQLGNTPLAKIDSGRAVFAFTSSTNTYARVLSITGTSIALGALLTVSTANGDGQGSIGVSNYDTEKHMVFWATSGGTQTTQAVTTSGTVVSLDGASVNSPTNADGSNNALSLGTLTKDLSYVVFKDTGVDNLVSYPIDTSSIPFVYGTKSTVKNTIDSDSSSYTIRNTESQALVTFTDSGGRNPTLAVMDVTSSSATAATIQRLSKSDELNMRFSGSFGKLSKLNGETIMFFWISSQVENMTQLNLNLTTSPMGSIECWLDVSNGSSYGFDTTGVELDTIQSLVSEPASSPTIDYTAYDWSLGATDSPGADDPTFNGTINGLSAADFFSFAGAQFLELQPGGVSAFLSSMHQNNASFSVVMVIRGSASPSNEFFLATGSAGAGPGMIFGSDGFGDMSIAVGNTTSTDVLNVTSSIGLGASTIQMVGVSVDEAAGAAGSFFFHQDSGGTTSETFDGTYSSPSASAASNARIGADLGGNFFFSNGTRLYTALVFDRALTLAEMTDVAGGLSPRYY